MDILIIEDEIATAQAIQFCLEQEGFSCRIYCDGLSGFQGFQEQQPDLIILDLLLPSLDGLEVCARIRQKPNAKDPYILMLTAKDEEIDRIIGLSTGADDYIIKPFSLRELVARVRALLRRSLRQASKTHTYNTQHFMVDLKQRTAYQYWESNQPEALDLTTLEFNLLSTLISYPGRVWSREQLIDKLWGSDFWGNEQVVDTHIARLRKKVESEPANPRFIKTVIGIGYKFEDTSVQ